MRPYGMQVRLIAANLVLCTSVLLCGQTASVSPTSLSFGNQAAGTTSTAKTVKLTNTSATALSISSITSLTAPPFTVTNNCPSSLILNASCTITATFAPATTGSFSQSISINDNAANTPQKITISGTGVVQASVSPASLSFGNVALGFSKTATVTFTNNLPTALAPTLMFSGDYTVNNTGISGPCGASLAGGAHCSIGITFTPTQLGTRAGTLTITDTATNSPQSVSLSGSGVTQATVSPASVSFGNIGLGVASTTSVTLTNNLPTTIVIGTPSAGGDYAINTGVSGSCGSTLAAGAHCSIGVTFTPTQLGTRTATLTIMDGASNSPQMVPLTGTGTTSSISSITLAPSSPTLIVNSSLQFTATANFPGAIAINVTNSATWSSSAAGYATINSQGLATSLTMGGTTTIKATYAGKSASTTLTITTPVKPLITWPTPAPITYGTSLSSTQLDAVATYNGAPVAGTYLYYPHAGDTPYYTQDGTILSVQFTPTDTVHYLPTTASVVLVVNRATVQIIFSNMTVPYNGVAQAPNVTTNLGGMPFVFNFNGAGPWWPVNAGSYQVVATVNWTDYQGRGTGTFVITKASPVFSNLRSQTIVAGTSSINVSGTIAAGAAIPAGEQVAITLNGGTPTYATIGSDGSFSANLNTSTLTASGTVYPITYTYDPAFNNDPNYNPVSDTTSSSLCASPTTGIAGIPGGFACGANTLAVRAQHTATLLNNGLILIAGGFGPGGIPLATAELYDPVANTSRYTNGAPITARANHTATLLDNGTVLFVGGVDAGGNRLPSAELYDPVADSFTPVQSSLTYPRQHHTATLLNDGSIAIVGGTGTFGDDLTAIEVYSPSTGAFSYAGDLSQARNSHSATLLSTGKLLVAGGYTGNNVTSSAEVVTVSGGTITTVASSMTSKRALHTASALGSGLVLLAGGVDGSGNPGNSAEMYDPIAGTFTSVTSILATMACSRANHSATELTNGTVLLAGGCSDPSNTAEVFDPGSLTFTSTNPLQLNTPRSQQTATLMHCSCPEDGWLLLEDGVNSGNNPLNSMEWYEPPNPTPAGLTGIQVSSGSASIALGTVAQFAATGTFLSGPQPLNAVSWSSSDPTILAINNDASNSGLAVPVSPGQVTVMACAGSVCGSTVVNVTP